MEMLGVRRKQKRNDDALKKKKKEKDIKVTYISSPMKVKTSASNFRALVQELTGQDSNVADKFLQQESAVHDHDDDEIENIDLAAMAGSSSNISDDQRHDEVEEIERSSPSSWLDLLTEDSCSGFQYSRSLFEPFNQQQQYMKFDLVEI
ncbi:hypothetical protein QN277_002045 [Acacia crassicarpa]|uniref:VQ domain-containing protein n=1 Tax=Acacia crassicarpa TaxID=499986 RepID=A0AAE1THN7_9FABA|nr:hypothetical protein QN277_002045 [Acacia crassicarpa]